ncbi:hypothetical protein ACFWC5_42150 [Streptomyces sp. NPDC060085]|uniref:hypothetical protein n=1 Tax=Streptomyces sp. NPDC060085 TaxID=3347054 RepID=UPI00365CEAA6
MASTDREKGEVWVDQVIDLGTQWGQYEYVTDVGFVACPSAFLATARERLAITPGRSGHVE